MWPRGGQEVIEIRNSCVDQRMADKLGTKPTSTPLRHPSVTELLTAGMDLRTIAGRLGHAEAEL